MVSSTAFSITSGGSTAAISVRTMPGATTFTVTPNLPSSRASVFEERPCRPGRRVVRLSELAAQAVDARDVHDAARARPS